MHSEALFPEKIRPISITTADFYNLLVLPVRSFLLRQLLNNGYSIVCWTYATKMMIENWENVVRVLDIYRCGVGTGPFEVVARPRPDIVIRVAIWVFLLVRQNKAC